METLDGRPATADELRSLALVGYGHFTSMRVEEGGRVRGLSLHMARLVRDCAAVWGTDLDTDKVRSYVRATLGDAQGATVARVTVCDPGLDMAHPSRSEGPHILVTTRPAPATPAPPLRVRTVRQERDAAPIKHVGLFSTLYARREAQLTGTFDDALLLDRTAHVSEGVTWNVGFLNAAGTVLWPSATVLSGVTMNLLQQEFAHDVIPISCEEATGMQAAFATNAATGVRAISCIDNTPMPIEHPVLKKLRDTYQSIPGEPI